MNKLPVTGSQCLCKDFWDRQRGKHCKLLDGSMEWKLPESHPAQSHVAPKKGKLPKQTNT